MELTTAISKSLGVPEDEACEILDDQISVALDMLTNDILEYDDVVDLIAGMGLEPDCMEEFLTRLM